jgi:4-aminobutyrate aminotransferase-like enzyme
MDRGLILGGLRPGVPETNTLRLAPPLVVTESEIAEALGILEEAVEQVSLRRGERVSVAGD